MLTPKEAKQLWTALDCMYQVHIGDQNYIILHNVKCLLQNYIAEGEVLEPAKRDPEKETP